MLKTLDSPDPEQCVPVRLDLNLPIRDGEIQDNRRLGRHAETVRELAEADRRVVLIAHQGRPDGDDLVSLGQHADILASHIDHGVGFVINTYGDDATATADTLETGDMLLLENMRMYDGEPPEEDPEVKADTEFARVLAEYVNAYVNDAYSMTHHSYTSLVGLPLVLPAYTGRVMQTEYETNSSAATRELDRQVMMAVGGTRTTDVIDIMNSLGDKADQLLLDGIAGRLFPRAAGNDVSLDLESMGFFDDQWEANREAIESLLDRRDDQIKLAIDLVHEDETDDRGEIVVASIMEKDYAYLGVGSTTVDEYDPIIRDSEVVFVKGVLGLFEDERLAVDMAGVLRVIAEADCFSVISGGSTSRAIGIYSMDEVDFGHVSIISGTCTRVLIDAPLAGIEVPRQG